MAFWGVEVKPGKPFTHSREKAKGRLRISQATLGMGNAKQKSIVQCNVGKKSPVLLCVLLPYQTESIQLDLEFEETDDVIFSVIGPRSIFLTGYYVRQINSGLHSDTESYGEDVGDSQTEGSSYCSDDDKYEDSFIDDGELKVSPPSPVSSNNDMDDAMPENDKPKDEKSHSKRLKKKYQVIESDDDARSRESEDEDGFLFSIFKNKKDAKKITDIGEKDAQNIAETNDRTNDNGIYSQKKEEVKPLGKKEKPRRKAKSSSTDEGNQVKSESPKEDEPLKESVDDKVLTDNKVHEKQLNVEIIDQDMPTSDGKNAVQSLDLKKPKKRKERSKKEEQPREIEIDKDQSHLGEDGEQILNASVKLENSANHASPELGCENGHKSKRRKKETTDNINHHSDGHSPGDSELKQGSLRADKSAKDSPDGESHEKITNNNISMKSELQANYSQPEKKTKKSTKKKDQSRVDVEVGLHSADAETVQRRTLSNGLTIEDISNGPPDGKVAAPGKKVKIFYTATLKEDGHVLDTNVGKSACKFRIGDKEITDGWNIGIDGMRVGDKRRITIPPSMGFGKIGMGENVPPNSWIVFDVELAGVRK